MKEFFWPVRVYYEDTDSGDVVYHANYLKFMERARTEWMRSLGLEQDHLLEQEGVVFVVRRVEVDFRRPARFNDALVVSLRIVERGRVSLTFQQAVRREADGELLCGGRVQVACLDATLLRPRALPENLLMEYLDAD